MHNLTEYIGIAFLFFASGAGIIGYFKANVSKATIELYKEDNDALRARLQTLETQARTDQAEIKALKSAHAYLTSVVTQADAIAAMRAMLDRIAVKVGA